MLALTTVATAVAMVAAAAATIAATVAMVTMIDVRHIDVGNCHCKIVTMAVATVAVPCTT